MQERQVYETEKHHYIHKSMDPVNKINQSSKKKNSNKAEFTSTKRLTLHCDSFNLIFIILNITKDEIDIQIYISILFIILLRVKKY